MAKYKSSSTRHILWLGVKAYMSYVERLAKEYNAVDGDFIQRHQLDKICIFFMYMLFRANLFKAESLFRTSDNTISTSITFIKFYYRGCIFIVKAYETKLAPFFAVATS